MNIFITGASRGIGKVTSKFLMDNGYSVKASCRKDGYDIKQNYEFVLNEIIDGDYDIFINNAYTPHYQSKLLEGVYDDWKNQQKQIINLGSCAGDMKMDNPDRNKEYPANKIIQDNIIKNINVDYCLGGYKNGEKCRVTNIRMGYVLTEFPSLYDKRLFPTIKPNYVAELIHWIINQPQGICIREISLHSTDEPILKD